MSMTLHITSTSPEQTEQVGQSIGQALRGHETIELRSDLGGGKTTFVRGLVRGLQSEDVVASPTFTISKLYRTLIGEVQHFDFYRLDDPGIIADELAEAVEDVKVITVVEWADTVQHVLPDQRIVIDIQQTPEGDRAIIIETTDQALDYALQEVAQ